MKLVYTADYVRNMLNIVDYRLPKQQELTDILRARKFAPMEIALQRYADFVTGDLEAFLKYIRLSNVKGVMYSYKYYTEEDISERFKVEDGDRSLFGGPPPVETSYYGIVPGQGSYVKREYKLSNTCYSMYIAYTKFLMETIDLAHPKELRLYALVEGKVIACQLADVWLERIDLLNRAMIRNMAMKHNLGRGDLSFYFYNYNPVHPAPEQMESSVSDPEMPEIQSDTEKNEPDAEPEKNDSKPETEKDQPETEKDQQESEKEQLVTEKDQPESEKDQPETEEEPETIAGYTFKEFYQMIKNGQVSFLENGIVCIDRSVETEPSYYKTTPYELMENNDNNSK